MKSKYDLLKYFAKLGFTTGAEIGVSQGYLSEKMFEIIPDLGLYCVDPWLRYKGNRWGGSQKRNDVHYELAKERLQKYNAVIMREFSNEAALKIPDNSLDFVYIDGNHAFDYVMLDLILWSEKVRPGGIVSGDDYYQFKGGGVVEAVDVYAKVHGIKPNFTNPLTDKIQDRGCQEQPSFWWIKL